MHKHSSRLSAFTEEQIGHLRAMEQVHFWSLARQRLILERLKQFSLGKRILDVGCGTGSLVAELNRRGYRALGIDPQSSGEIIEASAEELPFPRESFDAVILADVLEHLEENKPLEEAFRVLAPGGILLITVPAFPWAWGRRDEIAGHLRRYRSKDLLSIAERFGGKLLHLGFYQCLLFPLFLISRLFRIAPKREVSISSRLNALLLKVNLAEIWLGRWIRWPWGSSLIGVIKKT